MGIGGTPEWTRRRFLAAATAIAGGGPAAFAAVSPGPHRPGGLLGMDLDDPVGVDAAPEAPKFLALVVLMAVRDGSHRVRMAATGDEATVHYWPGGQCLEMVPPLRETVDALVAAVGQVGGPSGVLPARLGAGPLSVGYRIDRGVGRVAVEFALPATAAQSREAGVLMERVHAAQMALYGATTEDELVERMLAEGFDESSGAERARQAEQDAAPHRRGA